MTSAFRESNRAMTARLTREGRLESFTARVRELKAPCTNKTERKEAWAKAVAEFAADPPAPAPVDAFIDPHVFAGSKEPGYAATLHWVASHLDLKVRPEDSPGPRAWSLLQEARLKGFGPEVNHSHASLGRFAPRGAQESPERSVTKIVHPVVGAGPYRAAGYPYELGTR